SRGAAPTGSRRCATPPGRPLGAVLLHLDAVVLAHPLGAHPGLLHDPPRRSVVRIADGDHALELQIVERVAQARGRGLRREPLTPPLPPVVVGELDLGPGAVDEREPAVADQLAAAPALDRIEGEPVRALAAYLSVDGAPDARERWWWPRRQEPSHLRIEEHCKERRRVGRPERTQPQTRRLDREERRQILDQCPDLGHVRLVVLAAAGPAHAHVSARPEQLLVVQGLDLFPERRI